MEFRGIFQKDNLSFNLSSYYIIIVYPLCSIAHKKTYKFGLHVLIFFNRNGKSQY